MTRLSLCLSSSFIASMGLWESLTAPLKVLIEHHLEIKWRGKLQRWCPDRTFVIRNRQGIVTSARERSTQWNIQSYDKGGSNQSQDQPADLKPRLFVTVENSCSIQEKSRYPAWIQTLKIACRVRRWRSVKTKRGFLAWDPETGGSSSEASLFLHTENRETC